MNHGSCVASWSKKDGWTPTFNHAILSYLLGFSVAEIFFNLYITASWTWPVVGKLLIFKILEV